MEHRLRVFAIGILLCFTQNAGAISEISVGKLKNATRFTTWQGVEPDKWATLWLIKRHVAPNAYFVLVPPNTDLPDHAVRFGVPNAQIRRNGQGSMFRWLKQAMILDKAALNAIDLIIHDMEINIWDAPKHPHTRWVETLYRQLQARYQRDQAPVDCYLAFFDALAKLTVQAQVTAKDFREQLALTSLCPGTPDNQQMTLVNAMNHVDILRAISLGKHVVFVDTRENEEYHEVHLPGAKLLRLRDVNADSVQVFADADLVIPYCVKDFRAFEVAKSMKQWGLPEVATLSPNGLKGWLKAQLPVAKVGVTDEQAMQALLRCATEPAVCLQERY